MYNLPEMQPHNALFWNAISVELGRLGVGFAPPDLAFAARPVPECIAQETLFTQICGWPLQTIYRGQGVMLGTPVYDVPFCEGATHTGVFVVRREAHFKSVAHLRGCQFVFNSVHSNSGMNLPRRVIADLAGGQRFFGSIQETHSHPGNLERVAQGEADATCVDCVTYAFFMRHRPRFQSQLRVLAVTPTTPSLPFVTSVSTAPSVRAALEQALTRVGREAEWRTAREGLMIRDIVPPDIAQYRTQLNLETEAVALGYPTLM
jgi:ABC-type phosphate/phosphonate transport system substrate-binding protein